MNTLEFLVSDALVPAEFAPKLLSELTLPNLALLALRGTQKAPFPIADDTLLPSEQAWLFRHEKNINGAAAWACALGLSEESRDHFCWMLEPVHFEIGHSQLVLSDPDTLELAASETLALSDAARPVLADAGWQLEVASPRRWFLLRTEPADLSAPALECAIGQNVLPWMPTGDEKTARAWRATLNEIQMTWFSHPVNLAREDAARPLVNAVWLSGTGVPGFRALPYANITSARPLWSKLPLDSASRARLETTEVLVDAARSEDWHAFRIGLEKVDQRLGELAAELKAGVIGCLEVIFCGSDALRHVTLRRGDLWRVWRRGSVARLLAHPG